MNVQEQKTSIDPHAATITHTKRQQQSLFVYLPSLQTKPNYSQRLNQGQATAAHSHKHQNAK